MLIYLSRADNNEIVEVAGCNKCRRMLTTPAVLASAGIPISHSRTVANVRYKTLVACAVWGRHPQATARWSTQGQDRVLHKPDRLPGFALEKFGHLTPMTLTQVPSQAQLQLCLREETCMNLGNLISVSPEPSLQSPRQDRPHPRWMPQHWPPRPCLPWRKWVLAGYSSLCPETEVQNGLVNPSRIHLSLMG